MSMEQLRLVTTRAGQTAPPENLGAYYSKISGPEVFVLFIIIFDAQKGET